MEENKIIKIGGTCLTKAEHFLTIKQRLVASPPKLLIVSALGKTTAKLKQCIEYAAKGKAYQAGLKEISKQHYLVAQSVLEDSENYIATLQQEIADIVDMLNGIASKGSYINEQLNTMLSYGEYWSSRLFAQFWSDEAEVLDAAEVLVVDGLANQKMVDWQQTKNNLQAFLQKNQSKHWLITGFIARDKEGHLTHLGFEGSDYSATIFGVLFEVDEIQIWSDVDGLYSADPKVVSKAQLIASLSYHEAQELAYFGSSLLHPQSVQPALMANIPIRLSHALHTHSQGTLISCSPSPSTHAVRGVSAKSAVALINIEGSGIDIAKHTFEILNNNNIAVFLITEASSEQSICLAVDSAQLVAGLGALEKGLAPYIERGQVQSISHKSDRAILAVVGDEMKGQVGICAQLLNCLATANINIDALSQGGSERNISVVIEARHIDKAVNLVHAGFYLSKRRLQLVVIGPGNVGQSFLKQVFDSQARLKQTMQLELDVAAVCNSKKMVLQALPQSLELCMDKLTTEGQKLDFNLLYQKLSHDDLSHTVVVDCSASDDITNRYQAFIEHQSHIVSPNKKLMSGPLPRLKSVKAACDAQRRHFLYETNVCAGLPVIKTLQDLVTTGDVIYSIKGVFSGTLSYIFNQLSAGMSFSKAINQAYELGLTEPDPRDDLSGMDVARKCVCLARELGFETELAQVELQAILPDELLEGTIQSFLANHQALDQVFAKQLESLKATQHKLVYVGEISHDGAVKVQLIEVDKTSPFYNLKGTDNMVIFHTKRYDDNPLIIQGPGAGADVTAAGVFADVLRLAEKVYL